MNLDGEKFKTVQSFRQEICVFKRLAAVALAISLGAFGQTNMRPAQATDKEKIADALRAGPAFITMDAVLADWPANPRDPKAEYGILCSVKSVRNTKTRILSEPDEYPT